MDKRRNFLFFKGIKFSLADHIHKCHLLDYNLKFHLDLLPVKNALSTRAKDKYELRIEMEQTNYGGGGDSIQAPWCGGGTVSKLLGGKSTTLLPEGNTPTFTSLKDTPINFPSGTP